MSSPIPILCFSDVLCVYCYGGDVRFEELKRTFRGQIELSYHFIPVYGDVRRRIERSGKTPAEYSANVCSVARRFDHVEVAAGIFDEVVPASSTAAHLYLRAVKLLEDLAIVVGKDDDDSAFERLMWATRVAFFRDHIDVSQTENLDRLAVEHGIPPHEVRKVLDDGRACAELSNDLELQRLHQVTVSPSLVLNEGRQRLNGNVGYRVLEANVRELIRNPESEMSWC